MNRSSRTQGLSYRDRSHLSSTPEQSWRSSSNTPAGSGRSSPYGAAPSGHRYADDLEGQNDEALEGLTGKVKILKEVCPNFFRHLIEMCSMLKRPL
jgi:blocked early in transport 1